MSKYKLKIVTGYREEQTHTIDVSEAHKAYYLFLNPEARTIFNNGLAIRGQDIQTILPDYHATMGWNPAHKLMADDYNELESKGVTRKLNEYITLAKDVVRISGGEKIDRELLEACKELRLLNAPKSNCA